MATMNPPASERRHIPERRSSMGHARHATLSALDFTAMILMIIGAVNWGLLGAFDVNLVSALFGEQTPLSRLVYAVVGIAGLYGVYYLARNSMRRQ